MSARAKDGAILAALRALTAERDAAGRTGWITGRDLDPTNPEAAGRALARLAKAGLIERQVRRSYATVAVRWGFGGATACLRRKAEYRLVAK